MGMFLQILGIIYIVIVAIEVGVLGLAAILMKRDGINPWKTYKNAFMIGYNGDIIAQEDET